MSESLLILFLQLGLGGTSIFVLLAGMTMVGILLFMILMLFETLTPVTS